jgi:hypothetical protein
MAHRFRVALPAKDFLFNASRMLAIHIDDHFRHAFCNVRICQKGPFRIENQTQTTNASRKERKEWKMPK